MTYSYTVDETVTRSHARHIAAKIATDLKRMQRFYNAPPDEWIAAFEEEAIELLKEGLLDSVTYGFQKNGYWIEPTLSYTARHLIGITANDDDPGRVRPGAHINGARFSSYLVYSDLWERVTSAEKVAFTRRLPFRRTDAPEPDINGYWNADLTYSAGGRALDRASLRSP